MNKELINTDEAPAPVGPYSHAVRVSGDLLFISGQIPLDKNGNIVGDDIETQTKQVIENLNAILFSQGLSLQNIVKSTVLMTDLTKFQEMNEVYDTYFNESKPARAAYQVVKLPKDVMIEIEAVAVC